VSKPNSSHLSSRRLSPVLVLLLLLVGGNAKLYGQTPSPCATTDQSSQAWAQDATVYYNLSNITDPQAKQKIQDALTAWDTANQSNNSGVRFSSATPPAGAPTISFQVGGSNGSNAGHFDSTVNLSTGIIQSATVQIYTEGKTPGGNPIFDKGQPGYYDMFLKIALHEIGHTMGLNDAAVPTSGYCDQSDGATVMNGYCGTNDSGGNLSTKVTDCDKNALNSSDSPYPPKMNNPPLGGGGGGGGDLGGGGGYNYYPCTPYYWVYYESWDEGRTWDMVDYSYAGCW
jgi:hypothetical protein